MINIKSAQRLAPNSLLDWLGSRHQLRALRSLLVRLRCASQRHAPLNPTMEKIIHKIAQEEDAEHKALCMIEAIEKQHKTAKTAKKLRHAALQHQMPDSPKTNNNYLSAFILLSFWRNRKNSN